MDGRRTARRARGLWHGGLGLAITVAMLAPSTAWAQRDKPAGARPPARRSSNVPTGRDARHLAREGMRPLSVELPDTKSLPGLLPPDASQGLIGAKTRPNAADRGPAWRPLCYHWNASNLRYRPLYFEDAMLERNGQMHHPIIQPLASGARFFLTLPVLPYAMTVNPPRPTVSSLGYFRPGSPTPLLLQRPPLQTDAGLMEAGAWIGLIFLVP